MMNRVVSPLVDEGEKKREKKIHNANATRKRWATALAVAFSYLSLRAVATRPDYAHNTAV